VVQLPERSVNPSNLLAKSPMYSSLDSCHEALAHAVPPPLDDATRILTRSAQRCGGATRQSQCHGPRFPAPFLFKQVHIHKVDMLGREVSRKFIPADSYPWGKSAHGLKEFNAQVIVSKST